MKPRIKLKAVSNRALLYAGGLTLFFVCGFPFLWMILTSLKPLGEIFTKDPIFFTSNASLANFQRLFNDTNFMTFIRNKFYY